MASKQNGSGTAAGPQPKDPSSYSEGGLWPGANRSDVGRSHGTDLLESVRRWEAVVAPTSVPGSSAPGWEWLRQIRDPSSPNSGKFMHAATTRFWTVWVLSEDWGRTPAVNYEGKHPDLLILSRDLSRTMKRSKYDSAEGWAARIEWLYLAPHLGLPQVRSGEAEIARLIGRLEVLQEKSDAILGRQTANKERAQRGGITSAIRRREKTRKWLGASYSEMRIIADQHNAARVASGKAPLPKETMVRTVLKPKYPKIEGMNYQSLARRVFPNSNSLQVQKPERKTRT